MTVSGKMFIALCLDYFTLKNDCYANDLSGCMYDVLIFKNVSLSISCLWLLCLIDFLDCMLITNVREKILLEDNEKFGRESNKNMG